LQRFQFTFACTCEVWDCSITRSLTRNQHHSTRCPISSPSASPTVCDHNFYRATHATHASAVLAVVILSVCPSVTGVLCDNTKERTADILIAHERAITLSFLTPTVVGGPCPVPSEICAQSDPPFSRNADFYRFPLINSQP